MTISHRLLPLFATLLLPCVLSAQWRFGTVEGQVVDSAGQPVERATVRVIGLHIGTYTRPDGRFTIKRVPANPQLLRVTFPGMIQADAPVAVRSGGSVRVPQQIVLRLKPPNSVIVVRPRGEVRHDVTTVPVRRLDPSPPLGFSIRGGRAVESRAGETDPAATMESVPAKP